METDFSENSEDHKHIFNCNYCDYKCFKKQHIKQHLKAQSHKMAKGNAVSNSGNETEYNYVGDCLEFGCSECGKKYKNRSGLWKHKKTCVGLPKPSCVITNEETEIKKLTELVLNVVKHNQDLTDKIYEICKNGTTINNTNTNSHNKTFNLQFFLNETCKDAMNIMDFVDSIKLQLSDFERVGEVGFVNGISDIIIKNLKQLDITERPIHCTDKKREIMYVKDENKWEKEDDTNKKVRRAIKYIANKNINLMDAYKALHPDCQKSHSIYSDSYNKFVIEALGGSGNEDCDNEDKIISRVSKVVTIEK